jgi:hypothetical protein
MMMIAAEVKNWNASQVINPRLSAALPTSPRHSNGTKFVGAIRQRDAKKRDREVPYGMKGGEF